ncbi:hypothetical protein FNV43_RR12110 [Rhamnella rubrinervis]|uniref:Increased DNA methylation 3 n=1 Tax=Rhamnella rubrinervis TaxID=2594499 RepID=A0A8K0MIJ8_9ROSA|nr:hypothetical protein FNV43_RR12110 [Rhamnella rubrinervis]
MNLGWENECPRVLTENQHFLLNFIMGTYLGPDVKSDNPRYSTFHRLAEGSPSYTSSDLGPSYVSVSLLENLYYYVLRNAHPSQSLRPNMLHKYLKGSLTLRSPSDSWQFTSLFPLNLHEQIWYPTSFRIIKGIVLIDDPITSYVQEEDLEKFKSLSGRHSLKIDIDEFLHHQHEYRVSEEIEQDCMNKGDETNAGHISNGNDKSSVRFKQKYKRRRHRDPQPMPTFPNVVALSKDYSEEGDFQWTCKSDGPAIMPLLSIPSVEECTSNASTVLSGTARKAVVGPPVGVVDVGVNKVAYYFRVALPGVRKDYCKFNCEIESDGKVHIQGLTSGGKTIKKPSRVFEMKFQQLCPPGPFTLSFSLPGPVDPRLFAPNFRSDGIFEGVIMKDK